MKQYKGVAFARIDDPKVRDQLATIDEFLLDLQTGVARLSNGNSASASGGVIVAPPDLTPFLYLPGRVGGQTLKTVGWTSGAVPVFSITAANDVTAVLALTATNTTGQLVLTNTTLTMNTGALGYLDIHDNLVASSTYGPYLSVHGDAAPPIGDMILITSWFGNAAYGSASVPFEVRGRFFGHVGLCRVVGNAVPNFDFYGSPAANTAHAIFTQNDPDEALLDLTGASGATGDLLRLIKSDTTLLANFTRKGWLAITPDDPSYPYSPLHVNGPAPGADVITVSNTGGGGDDAMLTVIAPASDTSGVPWRIDSGIASPLELVRILRLRTSLVQFGSSSGSIIFDVPAAITDYTVTWPDNAGSAADVLTTDGYGTLSWAPAGGGAGTLSYTAQTATYAILTSDGIVDCDGTFTITLPTAVGVAGKYYELKNSGTGVITVDTTSAETIDGGATAVLTTQYESITVASTGTNWIII